MANDGSLADGNPQFAFDLETQKGVMALLAAVRASSLTAAQKNEVRDLAFLYTNGGRDQSVRITLQQKVLGYGLQPLASMAPVVAPVASVSPDHPFGTSRPAPSFSVAATQVSRVQPVIATTPQSVVSNQPSVSAPTSAEVVVPVSVPEPEPEPVITPEFVAVPISAPEPVATPSVTTPSGSPVTAEPSAVSYDQATAMQRIREIKALVNEKVGNPVNLVDIDNAVGREYMAALLDAMKRLSSGAAISSAMKRLEDSYLAVERTLEAHQSGIAVTENVPPSQTVTPNSIPQPITPTADPSVFQSMVQPVSPVAANIVEADSLQSQVVTTEVITEPVSGFQSIPATPEPDLAMPPVVEEVADVVPVLAPVSVPTPKPRTVTPPAAQPVPLPRTYGTVPVQDPDYVVSVKEDIIVDESQNVSAGMTPRVAPVTQVLSVDAVSSNEVEPAWGPATDHLPLQGQIVSVAETKEKLRTVQDLPTAAQVSTGGVGDSLFTKEVDDGLQQLLAEWPIFKKSGLFGTGPKGREHPLFKRISELQIPLLLAGRFEGATHEIKQSITDYMNGWRYEQGIIYEQGETFEHYLRRVIRHILDLQKR